MKKVGIILLFILNGCVHESAIPLGNDIAQIDISAAPIYGRAGAVRIAMQNAAKITLDMGYDKFIIIQNDAWTMPVNSSGSYSVINANSASASGSSGSYATTLQKPESKMLIKMLHAGDKGADKAIDARIIMNNSKEN